MATQTPIKHCRECGAIFAATRSDAEFCRGASCRRDWNNRRLQRGAELYDLFMTIRHERRLTEKLKGDGFNLWTAACRLAMHWKIEDEQDRGGRRSYQYVPDLVAKGKFTSLAGVFIGIDGTGIFKSSHQK